jgi:16S rRNA (uracil1498-N3)-methyltransferase
VVCIDFAKAGERVTRRRLHAAQLPEVLATLTLDEEARRHAQVLRLALGDEVCLFDGAGREADARVTRIERHALTCEVQPLRAAAPRAARLCLIVCIPKAAKLEMIVRMATELGVHAIYLAQSERAVPKLSSESPKLERLRRIALEACAQSGQLWAPLLMGPMPLAAAASAAPIDAEKLVFWEASKAALAVKPEAREVWAVVGPEGGICEHEVDVLALQGYAVSGLGAGILRVETACIVVAALLLDRMGALR